jgi:nucleoside-diphosphate-sugar epimerase
VDAVQHLVETGEGKGRAYNISQDESVTIEEFLQLLGQLMDVEPEIVRVPRLDLEASGFVPDCSPFSERWMSVLTNQRSKDELDMVYTPLDDYLKLLVQYYEKHKPPVPVGYKRRPAELQFAKERQAG